MSKDFRPADTTLTREAYLRLMAKRTRPIEEPYIPNGRAARWRDEQAVTSSSALDAVLDDIEDKAEARRRLAQRLAQLPEWRDDTPAPATSGQGFIGADGLVHGTRGGYVRHKRRGEPKCVPCWDAARATTAERRAKTKEATE